MRKVVLAFAVLCGLLVAPFSYANFSGFQTFFVNQATVPAPAATWGLTSEKFHDNFTSLSTIDVNNTGNAGYNWYVQCNFNSIGVTNTGSSAGSGTITIASSYPTFGSNYVINGVQVIDFTHPTAIPNPTYVTGVSGTPGSGAFTVSLSNNVAAPGVSSGDTITFQYPPQPSATMSIVSQGGFSQVLKLSNVGQTESNYSLGTIWVTGNNVGYTGYTTGQNKSFYAQMSVAFDETLAPGTCCTNIRWPALSAYSYPGTSGGSTDEIDFIDAQPGAGMQVALSYFLHEYGDAGGTTNQVSYTNTGRGQIATLGSITGGSGYVNGTHNNVPLYDVNGSTNSTITGATATVVVSGGAVTSVTVVTPGLRANSSETLTTPNSSLGGSGSGFQVPISTVSTLVFTATQFHTWAVLYIVTGDNSGTGIYSYYFDGMFIGYTPSLAGSVTVTTTGVASPGSDNPQNGEFTAPQTNGTGFTMVIASGQQAGGADWPMYIHDFEVWQKP
jgi:hypothetical protein